MSQRQYVYVGPTDIRDAALTASPVGCPIGSPQELAGWVANNSSDVESDGSLIATFVIKSDGVLLLSPRRSEHVACAGGDPVLSAGEIRFANGTVVEISNQSTGYCPEPESWPAVANAFDAIPLAHPGEFTTRIVFRRCPNCNERNIIKDGWFVCDLCGNDLPQEWNFPLQK